MEWSIPEPAGMATIFEYLTKPLGYRFFSRSMMARTSLVSMTLIQASIGLYHWPVFRSWTRSGVVLAVSFFIMEWSIPEPEEMATVYFSIPAEGWRTIVLYCHSPWLWYNWSYDSKQRRGGREGWAGASVHNNDPEFRSSIASMVAKPTGFCIIGNMKNENTPTQDQDLDAYWLALAERFETDNADIGSEFDI